MFPSGKPAVQSRVAAIAIVTPLNLILVAYEQKKLNRERHNAQQRNAHPVGTGVQLVKHFVERLVQKE